MRGRRGGEERAERGREEGRSAREGGDGREQSGDMGEREEGRKVSGAALGRIRVSGHGSACHGVTVQAGSGWHVTEVTQEATRYLSQVRARASERKGG